MYTLNISIRVISDEEINIDISDKPEDWDIHISYKGKPTGKILWLKAQANIVVIDDIIEFENEFNEAVVLSKMTPALNYLTAKKVKGQKELRLGCIIENEFSGFSISPKTMKLLVAHDCHFLLSGIYFDDRQ